MKNKMERVFYLIGNGIMGLIGVCIAICGINYVTNIGWLSLGLVIVGLCIAGNSVKKIYNPEGQLKAEEEVVDQTDHEQSDVQKTTSNQDKKEKVTSARKTIAAILGLIAVIGIVLGLISMILRFAIAGIMLGSISIMVLIEDRTHLRGMVIILSLYVFLMSFIQVISLNTTCSWIYPLQSAYIGTLGNTVEPDWFPDQWENIVSDFHFDYCMSWMDPGHYVVSYNTTPEHVQELEEIYAPISEKAKAEALERYGENAVYSYDNKRVNHGKDNENNYLIMGSYKEFLEQKDYLWNETTAETLECYMVYIIDYKNCREVYNGKVYENQRKCGVLIIDVVEDRAGEVICRVEFNSQ